LGLVVYLLLSDPHYIEILRFDDSLMNLLDLWLLVDMLLLLWDAYWDIVLLTLVVLDHFFIVEC